MFDVEGQEINACNRIKCVGLPICRHPERSRPLDYARG